MSAPGGQGAKDPRPSLCANCARRPPVARSRLAPGEPMVWLCDECASGKIDEIRVPDRGYEVPERDYAATIRAIAQDVPRGRVTRKRYNGKAPAPGFVVERVLKRGGMTRDQARETLHGNSWFSELRYLGVSDRWYLFERPDVDLARRARSEGNLDVAAGLSELATGNGATTRGGEGDDDA